MDKDIAPELIEKVNKDFERNISQDKSVNALNEKLAAGQAKYEDAYKYAESVGNARAKAFKDQISSEVLPEGKMHYNIGSRLMTDSLTTDHNMVAEYAAGVQKSYNEKAGISLKALKADVDEDRIDGFVQRLASEEVFDDVAWIMQEPVVTHSRSVVDDTIKKNAEFQHKAGLTAKVTRKAAPRCCDWCTDLEGDYTYPNVPREVFQRHDNCKCTVDYDGKRLKAHDSGRNDHTFRDPDEGRRSSGSSGSGRSAKDRKDWHGYGSQKAYVNRFADKEKRVAIANELLNNSNNYDKVKSRIERDRSDLTKREFAKQIDAHPEMLGRYTPTTLKETLERAGYDVKPLSKGNWKGIAFEEGGGYKVNYSGNGIISYHPAERSHHKGAYYKISNGPKGIRRYDLSGREKTD